MTDFHFTSPWSSCTPESFGFLSSMCISNSLQYQTSAAYMGIFLLLFFSTLLLLARQLVLLARWTLSCTILTLAASIIFGLFLQQLGNFVGATGVLRMFLFGVPYSVLVTGVTLVFTQWFIIVSATSAKQQFVKRKNLWIAFFAFNLTFQILYWGFWLTAGGFADPKIHNTLGGVAMFILGFFAVFIGAAVLHLGQRLAGILRDTVDASPSPGATAVKIKKSSDKILRYSLLQSFLWLSGGMSALGVGIWAFASGDAGVTGFYYLVNFAWAPMTTMVAALLIYAAMMMGRTGQRTQQGSKEPDMKDSAEAAASLTDKKVDAIIGSLKKVEEAAD